MTRSGFDLEGITPDDHGHVPPGVHRTAVIGEPPEHRDWREAHRVLAPFVHETARVGPLATIDAGMYGATSIGARSWVFAHAHIGHDAIVMQDVEVSTGAIIGGHCILGPGCKVGLGAVLLPKVVIGEGARIGAGAVVTKNVPAGETWAGNPAKPVGSQDPDRKVTVCGIETTVGEIQSRPIRCAEAGAAMTERPHPITRAGAREGQIDAWGHSVDAPREGTPFVPEDPKTMQQLYAERNTYEEWKTTDAGQRWFEERAARYADPAAELAAYVSGAIGGGISAETTCASAAALRERLPASATGESRCDQPTRGEASRS